MSAEIEASRMLEYSEFEKMVEGTDRTILSSKRAMIDQIVGSPEPIKPNQNLDLILED